MPTERERVWERTKWFKVRWIQDGDEMKVNEYVFLESTFLFTSFVLFAHNLNNALCGGVFFFFAQMIWNNSNCDIYSVDNKKELLLNDADNDDLLEMTFKWINDCPWKRMNGMWKWEFGMTSMSYMRVCEVNNALIIRMVGKCSQAFVLFITFFVVRFFSPIFRSICVQLIYFKVWQKHSIFSTFNLFGSIKYVVICLFPTEFLYWPFKWNDANDRQN